MRAFVCAHVLMCMQVFVSVPLVCVFVCLCACLCIRLCLLAERRVHTHACAFTYGQSVPGDLEIIMQLYARQLDGSNSKAGVHTISKGRVK